MISAPDESERERRRQAEALEGLESPPEDAFTEDLSEFLVFD